MSKRKPRNSELAYLSQDEPIVLVGQPEALRGEVGLHNQGARSVVLREVQVRSEPLTRVAAATPMTHSLPPIALRSGQTRYVPLGLSISRHTPPGEYHGELEVSGQVLPVVLHVIETVQLDISPSQLVIESRAGVTVDKRAVFSNRGNIPLTIGAIGPVPLEDEFLQCRTLRGALDAVGDQKKSLEEYVAEVAHQARAVLERSGFLRVYNVAGTTVLQPGEVCPIDLKIRVPEKLERHTRYRGVTPLYDTNLEFIVVRSPDEQVAPEPAEVSNTLP
jgi:hypothetical protein